MEAATSNESDDNVQNVSNISVSSKESETENIDAIQKFIEDQERQIQRHQAGMKTGIDDKKDEENINELIEELKTEDVNEENKNESTGCSPSILDMMMKESEAQDAKKTGSSIKQSLSAIDKGNGSVSLSVGSKVEVKDFSNQWHIAEIIEVDFDELEVLVCYGSDVKRNKQDEWINVSSPRLRPVIANQQPAQDEPSTSKQQEALQAQPNPETSAVIKDEPKEMVQEEKPKHAFEIGERCLARWRDNKRFMATINNILDDGTYEIMFDDGFYWKCSISRLYKWKPDKITGLTMDTTAQNPTTSHSPVQFGDGPTNAPLNTPVFHKHLFDPTRDYLGSKSERREMKRKLNIKEIFNIGQKRSKTPKIVDKERKPPTEKKVRVIKSVPKLKAAQAKVKLEEKKLKLDLKTAIPDAVASIIGTITKEEPEMKKESEFMEVKDKNLKDFAIFTEKVNNKDSIVNDDNHDKSSVINEMVASSDSSEVKSDIDPVLEEETVLEKFEQLDEVKHEQVIDRMKEMINKLEDGINQIVKSNSPKPEVKEEPSQEVSSTEIISETVKVEDPIKHDQTEEEQDVKYQIPQDLEKQDPEEKDKTKPDQPQDTTEQDHTHSESTQQDLPSEAVVDPEIENVEVVVVNPDKPKKMSKVKKSKKIRLLQEKRVKKQVEQVKNELEEMKKQVEEMRKQMLVKTEELAKRQLQELPESYLLPGEWCCKWVNKQPVGTVSEIESDIKFDGNNKPVLPRRSVQVEDKRLPPGWTKHMVRRSFGNSAGKWDVVLVNPENRRFHTKSDMRSYLENIKDESLGQYEYALLDFGVHLKLSRRMGWMTYTSGGEAEGPSPANEPVSSASPLVKRNRLNVKKKKDKTREKRFKMKLKFREPKNNLGQSSPIPEGSEDFPVESTFSEQIEPEYPPLEDGFVYVGSLKVQIIENLLRCPAEGCVKNFRNNTLLQMHIKHYHRELRKMLGTTPKVADLAYARTMPTDVEPPRPVEHKVGKAKIPKPKREEPKEPKEPKESKPDLQVVISPLPVTPTKSEPEARPQDSPKLRLALNKPVKRPRVLLPVRRTDPEVQEPSQITPMYETPDMMYEIERPIEQLDFETAISTHTVTKPLNEKRKKDTKRMSFIQKQPEEDDWFANSDFETTSSFPRSGSPDSKTMDGKVQVPISSESNNEEQKDENMYMYNENGERIKIVHMKREEIINCHCGFREEDGLMVQCELCLCWQHALCHNIQREADVPERYTCSICLKPRRGRRSQRFLHEQGRLYEGQLPAGKPCDHLRRSHELTGNLVRITDALHALRVKYYVATKKDHPKLYLWAKDWEHAEIAFTQEKLNNDYTDLNIMINNIGKENFPVKTDEMKDMPMDIRTPMMDDSDHDRFMQRDGNLGSQMLLSGLLSSPDGPSLDLPISTSELERFAKSVQEEQECGDGVGVGGVGVGGVGVGVGVGGVGAGAPQPEAAIVSGECRKRLLRHVQRCQALIDARLDSIEAQVAELESQDPSFEDDESPDFLPRTKRTVQMLMRDLDTMEELGLIT